MTSDIPGMTILITAAVLIVVLDDFNRLTEPMMWSIVLTGLFAYIGLWGYRWHSYKRASGETE